jgi:NAD-dependent SIR2 family protein deacetylase
MSCHATDAPADHYDLQCSQCHNTTAWVDVNVDHTGLTDCVACHEADRPENHPRAQCSNCHNTISWFDVLDAESTTAFVIVQDGSLQVNCAACHSLE